MIYCPYTNKELSINDASPEHIIPFSLGGINSFKIPVCRQFNTHVGSKIDGAIANDPIILMLRNRFDMRGHSGQKPGLVSKKSYEVDTGKRVHVTLDMKDGAKVWSPVDKKYLAGRGTIKISGAIRVDSDIKFVAKVALSAGYFTYGNLFRSCVDHDELRFIMNFNLDTDINDTRAKQIKTTVQRRFSDNQNPTTGSLQAFCTALSPSSIVVFQPQKESLKIHVGILGQYMGMLNVPAITNNFPNSNEHNLGHVIALQDKTLVRVSYQHAIEQIKAHLASTKPIK